MAEVVDIDLIISKLLEVRGARPGKNVQLSEVDIRNLCLKSREIFLSQPILLELEAPLKICGEFTLQRENCSGARFGFVVYMTCMYIYLVRLCSVRA